MTLASFGERMRPPFDTEGGVPMVSADAVFALVSVLLLVGMAGLMGAFLAGFRVPKMEGRPSKSRNPVGTGNNWRAVWRCRWSRHTLRHITDGLAQHRALGGVCDKLYEPKWLMAEWDRTKRG